MKKISSISLAVFTVLTATMALSSCEKDNLSSFTRNGGMVFRVTTDAAIQTKSAEVNETNTVDLSTPEIKLVMTSSKHVTTTNPFAVETKGTIINSDNFAAKRSTFDVQAYNHGTSEVTLGIASPIQVGNCPNGEYWSAKTSDGEKVSWPDNGAEMSVWAYSSPSAYTATNNTGSYTSPALDADHTEDFLVGYGHGSHTHTSNIALNYEEEDMPVTFYHSLAAIRFILGELDGYSVKSIAINNLKKSGTFEFNSAATTVDGKFTWTTEGEGVTYSQTYSTTKESNFVGTASESTFFVIPQAFAEGDVTFTFTFVSETGSEISLTTDKIGVQNYMPGYTYTYNVGSDTQKVGIDIIETFDLKTKSNVYVTNTNTLPVFVRVAVVANWFYSNGKVGGAVNTPNFAEGKSDWVKGDDGYYYYSKKLFCGENTQTLIDSFTKTDYTAPKPGLHMEMKIMAQAVECADATDAQTAFAN